MALAKYVGQPLVVAYDHTTARISILLVVPQAAYCIALLVAVTSTIYLLYRQKFFSISLEDGSLAIRIKLIPSWFRRAPEAPKAPEVFIIEAAIPAPPPAPAADPAVPSVPSLDSFVVDSGAPEDYDGTSDHSSPTVRSWEQRTGKKPSAFGPGRGQWDHPKDRPLVKIDDIYYPNAVLIPKGTQKHKICQGPCTYTAVRGTKAAPIMGTRVRAEPLGDMMGEAHACDFDVESYVPFLSQKTRHRPPTVHNFLQAPPPGRASDTHYAYVSSD